MKLRFVLTLCFVVALMARSFSQQNDLDQQYAPKGSPALSDDVKSSSSSNSSSSYNTDYPANIVKWAPFCLARSIVAFHYERNIHDNISLQAGLGICYNKDYIFQSIGSDLDFSSLSGTNNQLTLSTVYNSSTSAGISPYFFVAPKFLFESYWWDGYSYVELAYRHYANRLNYQVNPSDASSSNIVFTGDNRVTVSQNQFFVNFGHQFLTSGKISTSHELYTGIGFRSTKYDPIQISQGTDSYGNAIQIYSKGSSKLSGTGFMFTVGYIFGIGFGTRK